MGSKKMGRPTDNPKPYEVKARLDAETYLILANYCHQTGKLISEAIREGIHRLQTEKTQEGVFRMNQVEANIQAEWEKYQAQKKDELYPNIMLLGTSGAGKSSLINRIFGEYVAETSDVEPKTRGFQLYMGKKYAKTINLIDSAGYELGGAEQYYQEIRKVISQGVGGEEIHIIWYCVPVTNERVEDMDLSVLRNLIREPKIRKRICVVFTKCDEDTEDSEKAKALQSVLQSHLDFPLPYFETSSMPEYDLDNEKLIQWSADNIDDEDLRNRFIGAQMADLESKREAAGKVICVAAASAAVVGASPIPFSDAVVLVPIQVAMAGKIIDIYGVTSLVHISTAMLSDVVLTNFGKSLASGLVKLIPVMGPLVGGTINAGVASGLTAALGSVISGLLYDNVKKSLRGENPAWDQIFESADFLLKVKENYRNQGRSDG